MTVLVLGGSSQIGHFLLPRLVERGESVLALSRRPPASRAGVHWISGKLPDAMPAALPPLSAIVSYGPLLPFARWLAQASLTGALAGRMEPLETHHLDTIGSEVAGEPDERLASLYAFIGELEPLNRALILLYLDDRPYAEIADVLGISETNVATKLGRIKQTLRGRMTAAATTGA